MGTSIRDITTEYIQAVADGRLDQVEALLHPDLVFDGTVPAPRGKASYVDALRVLTTIIVRSDIRDIVVEGDRAFVLYDFVTDTPAGSVLRRAAQLR
jgi:SnoaL-like domain